MVRVEPKPYDPRTDPPPVYLAAFQDFPGRRPQLRPGTSPMCRPGGGGAPAAPAGKGGPPGKGGKADPKGKVDPTGKPDPKAAAKGAPPKKK